MLIVINIALYGVNLPKSMNNSLVKSFLNFYEELIQNQVDTVIREEDTITRLEIIDENITYEIGKLNQKIENEKVKALSTSY